jgi:hypothetical protein
MALHHQSKNQPILVYISEASTAVAKIFVLVAILALLIIVAYLIAPSNIHSLQVNRELFHIYALSLLDTFHDPGNANYDWPWLV